MKAGDDITKAQVNATFLDLVTGQEAPIKHGQESETDAKGETVFLRFSVCAAWNQPEDAKDSNYVSTRRSRTPLTRRLPRTRPWRRTTTTTSVRSARHLPGSGDAARSDWVGSVQPVRSQSADLLSGAPPAR